MKLLLTKILILICCLSANGQISFTTKISRCGDGDTCDFFHSDGVPDRIRLYGIDAPEIARSSKEISQPFGLKCKRMLTELVANQTVEIETFRRDNYGRILGRILINEQDINLTLLQRGCAWVFTFSGFPRILLVDYRDASREAIRTRTGLFGLSRPVEPRIWRKRKHYLKRKK